MLRANFKVLVIKSLESVDVRLIVARMDHWGICYMIKIMMVFT